MTTLTAQEFLKITQENPKWAKTLTENVTITGKVILPYKHPLKALSPKLIFQDHADLGNSNISVAEGVFHQGVNFSGSQIQEIGELTVLGPNEEGNAATFNGCQNLTIAKGTFPGFVDFGDSGIQKIADDFQVTAPNKEGYAASFWQCRNLTIARGTFPGFVNFSSSGIQKIADDLNITAPDEKGYAADFHRCKKLTVARGKFPGFVSFSSSGIQEIAKDLSVTGPNISGDAARFENCKNLTVASGKFRGTVSFMETLITHAQNLEITVQEGKPKAIFTEFCLKESPFPLEEIQIPEELKKKLHRKIVQKLHKSLEDHFPSIPQEI